MADDRANLARNIKERRRKLNLNQLELAERSNLSIVTIKQVETKKRWPRPETLAAIAEALEASVADLMGSPTEAAPPTPLKSFGLHIRHLRESRGWSLEKMADQGFPSWKHLQKIESGEKNITLITLNNLCDAFNISLAELFKKYK